MTSNGDGNELSDRADPTFLWLLRRNQVDWADDAALMQRASKARIHKRNITKLTDIKSVNSVKLLYILGMYTQNSSRKVLKEVAIRFLSLQLLVFEAIKAGLLTYDYAPTNVEVCDGTGTRRLYVNISQEATSDILWFIEAELASRISVSTQYNRSVVALQLTPKGAMMCRGIDIGIQASMRAFFFKGNSLLQVKFDNQANDGSGGFYCFIPESSQISPSEVTEIHNISYVASPFIPASQLHHTNTKPFLSNSSRASESVKGKAVEGSDKYRIQNITIVLPKLLLIEWIPIGINSILQLSSQLGVLERCQGGMFSAGEGKQSAAVSGNTFEASPGLTSIRVLDFDFGKYINFEADIRYPESEGVVQVEFFGINMNANGCVTYGMRMEAIGIYIADRVQLEGISRVFVDMNQDAARVCGDLLSDLQRSLVACMHGCSVESRKKFHMIVCEQLIPSHAHDVMQYTTDPALTNELRQVIGDPQFALTCLLDMDEEGVLLNVVVETQVSQTNEQGPMQLSESKPSTSPPAIAASGEAMKKFSTAAAVLSAFNSPMGALALGRCLSTPKKQSSKFRYQESSSKGVVIVIVGADGAIAAGKHSEKIEPILLELAKCQAFVLSGNVLSDRVSAAAAQVLVLRSLVHSKLNNDPENPSKAKKLKQELESECAMLTTLSKLLLQEIRAAGAPIAPIWEGLYNDLRIKTTRENAEFLASGLVKKLFQIQQALRHISYSISFVAKLNSFDAAARMNSHAAALVSESSVSVENRSQTLNRIAIIALFIVVLQGTDFLGPSLGASNLLNIPIIWMVLTVLVACAAVTILQVMKKRMHRTKGDFVLKHDVNIPVRLSALRQWLRKQLFVKEMRRGTRVHEQVRVTQASALKDNACALTCVYETAAQRLLRVEIRGRNSASDLKSADYGNGLLENLMELLDNAGVLTQARKNASGQVELGASGDGVNAVDGDGECQRTREANGHENDSLTAKDVV